MEPNGLTTSLITAARLGDINALKNALPDDVGKLGPDGLSALHVAILSNHEECCLLLAPYEALVQTGDGVLPLVLAIRVGNEAMVEMLLEFYDDTQYQGTFSLLDEAILCGNVNIVKKLLSRDFTMEQILQALKTAHDGSSYDIMHKILSRYLLLRQEGTQITRDASESSIKTKSIAPAMEAMRNTAPLSISQLKQSVSIEPAVILPQPGAFLRGHLGPSDINSKTGDGLDLGLSQTLTDQNMKEMTKENLIHLCLQLQEELKITTMEADRLERILAEVNNAEASMLQASRILSSPIKSLAQPCLQTKAIGTSPTLDQKSNEEARIVSVEEYKKLQSVLTDLQITFEGMQKRMTEVELAYIQEKRNARELREKLREKIKEKPTVAPSHGIVVQKRPTSAQASHVSRTAHTLQTSHLRASSHKKVLPTPTSIAAHLAASTTPGTKEAEIERLRMEIISKNTEILSIQAQIHSLEHASLHTYGAVRDRDLIIDARERLERAKHRSRVAQAQLDKLLMSNSSATPQRTRVHALG